jgi:predicted RNA-binding protein with PIN domain
VTVLVIDGYNLLHALIKAEGRRELGERLEEGRLEDERHRLLDRIASYLGGTRDRAIVVFDAKKSKLEKQAASGKNVEVFFGSFDRSADAIIEREAYSLPEEESIVVVSSDYDVQKTVFRGSVTRRSSAHPQFRAEKSSSAALLSLTTVTAREYDLGIRLEPFC